MVWSKTKKQLDSFMCNSLKGRVEFFCSSYRMHDGIGRIYITIDGNEVYNMCTLKAGYYGDPKEGMYSQIEFLEAVNEYFNSPISKLLISENVLIRILVLLDRRIGKVTLKNMRETIATEEEVIQFFYKLRCNSEGLNLGKEV